MSLLGRRLIATLTTLWVLLIGSQGVVSADLAPSTWVALKALPHQGRSAIFALSVDPSNNQLLLAGNSEGSLLRSADGGSTWTSVHSGKVLFNTIAFSPYKQGLVLAGTRGGGALVSSDGGATWSAAGGLDGRSVRVFGYSLTLIAAGTDRGVYVSPDGSSWSPSGLADRSIGAIAVAAVHTPVRLLAASDAPLASGSLPLFQSTDGGASWTSLVAPISGTFIVKLAAGPLPPTGNTRPLLAGTNGGLFASADNGFSFTPLSGGDLLPSTDYTQIAFITDHHYDRFYAASDGGGSGAGGLWRTTDSGGSFTSLAPPAPSVTALAVSNDESPVLYVATFRPSDHTPALWVYHDTGGIPQGPPVTPSPFASGARTSPSPGSSSNLLGFLSSPEVPYIGLGVAALVVILLAAVSHLRGRRR